MLVKAHLPKFSLLLLKTLVFSLASLTPPAVLSQNLPVVQMIKRNAVGFAVDGNRGGSNGQDVYLYSRRQSNVNQQWVEISRGNNFYSYQKMGTNFCLDGGKGGANGQNVYLYTCRSDNQNQHWRKVRVDGNFYRFEKRNAPGYSIDGNRGGKDLQSVYLWASSDRNHNQLWSLNSVSSTNPGNTNPTTTVPATIPAATPGANTFVGGGGTVAGAPSHGCNTQSGFTVVNSVRSMISAMRQSNVRVALAPGTYSLDKNDAGLFARQSLPGDRGGRTLLSVNGNNSRYDFRCTKLNIDTDLWREFGRDEVIQLRTVGNNNTISNLTIEDIGSTSPSGGALNVMMDGRDNVLEGSVITARGSDPYGLGDAYGKGGGPVLSHRKHSVVLIRGLRNTLRNSTVFNFAYGHSVFMQGSEDTLIDGVYIQGELRSTNDMLAANNRRFAAADARARSVNFTTEWGYRLPRGYWMSLQEAGIRAYNGGRTVIDGREYQRGAEDVTVLNSVIRHTRTGVTLAHARGRRYVENTTVLEVEQGYSIGSGDIVDSYGDANVGPVLSFAYSSDRGTNADITILPTDGARNGWGALAFIGGSNHNITLRSSARSVNQNLPVVVSGDKHSIRHLNGALANQDNLTVRNTTVNNLTNFPMVLNNLAEGTRGQSNGRISGNTRRNSVRQN